MNKIQRNERSRVKLALQMVLRDITSFHLPRPTLSLYFPSSKSKRNWLHTGITFSRTEFKNGRNISIESRGKSGTEAWRVLLADSRDSLVDHPCINRVRAKPVASAPPPLPIFSVEARGNLRGAHRPTNLR